MIHRIMMAGVWRSSWLIEGGDGGVAYAQFGFERRDLVVLALNAVRSAAMDLFGVGPVIPETTQA
jgi:hypothetical protein